MFFCTEDVLHSAARHGLTNFRFLRAEDGHSPSSKGIKYLPDYSGVQLSAAAKH
jgi:hypothetical protein